MQSAPTHPCFPWFFASSLVSFTAEGSSTAKVREAADVNRSSTAGHEDAGPLCFVFTGTGSSPLRSFSCESAAPCARIFQSQFGGCLSSGFWTHAFARTRQAQL